VAKKHKPRQKGKSASPFNPESRLTAAKASAPGILGGTDAERAFSRACQAHQHGRLEQAELAYRETVRLNPRRGEAWRNLGALLRRRGAFAEGRHCTEQALKLDASDPSLWGNYGNVLRDLELYEESLRAFAEGLKRQPGNLALIQGQAITLGGQKRFSEVVQLLSPWLEQEAPTGGNNQLAEVLLELGNAHHALHHRELALQCWRQGALSAEGDKRLFIGLNTAQVLCEQKRFAEAALVCGELQELFPEDPKLIYANAMVAKGLGQVERAIELFDRALTLKPSYPICLNSYGLLLREIGRIHQARVCFERALEHDPSFGAAMNNLGSVLKDVARYDESLVWLRRGAEAMADSPAAHSNVLFTLVGYELEGPDERFAEARRYASRVAQSPYPRHRDSIPDPDPDRVLQLGLISPDFCRHAVSYFIEPLLEQWDRKQLRVTLYACGDQQDDYTARLQGKADQWRDLRGQSDETAIAQIQRDEIDILIDLAGHTAGNRLPVFAAKPAPIQATYLGYYGTTGLDQVDYWLTDAVLHPPDRDHLDPASEERWRLDRCYVSYRPLPAAPDVAPAPCLKNGRISFGSFNQSRKITFETAQHWMAVLTAVPHSQLVLKSKNLGEASERQRVQELFGELGLDPQRLQLLSHSPSVREHLEAYQLVDLALDTFPYTGCTTTADALWMGVPVLTVAGDSMVSRQAAAVLHGAGQPQWVCRSSAELAALASALAERPEALAILRQQLRQQVAASPLLDSASLAKTTQVSFREWWHRWLQQQGWSRQPAQQGQGICWREPQPLPTARVPMANSPRRCLPLWAGHLPARERQRWESQGYCIQEINGLVCWQILPRLFDRERRGEQLLLHWPEAMGDGLLQQQLQRWRATYPQLLLEPQGPG